MDSALISPSKTVEFIEEFYVELFIKIISLPLSLTLMKNHLLYVVEHISKASKQVLRLQRSKMKVRVGWRECAQAIERDGVDDLLLCEFPNLDDKDLVW
jgi:hypothetical protein